MRFLFTFLCFMTLITPLHAEEKAEYNGAHFSFEQTEFDFGTISRREKDKSCIFHFVNDGTEPLVILSAITSCSCLKAEFPRKPVGVGERGEIRLILEPQKVDKGIFRRIVQIRSTSTTGTAILTIKGVAKD